MIEKIRKFFKNKKTDAAFKRAGPGYKLDGTSLSVESTKGNSSCNTGYQPPLNRSSLSQESKQAAAAALARLDKQKNQSKFNKSLATVRARVRQEMEAEKLAASSALNGAQRKTIPEVEFESASQLAVQGVYFQCPLLGPDILTKEEWNHKIREFLYDQLNEEKGLVACLIVHTLNKSKDKIDDCINTITKYFENILQNPTDEKYRKIRMSNKVFLDKVKPIEGAMLILEAAGFEVKELPHQNTKENFLVFPNEKLSNAPETFEILLDGLRNAEPITLELYRNLQVLLPAQAKESIELPPSFYNLTIEEIKKEQLLRSEIVQQNQILKTKSMREKDGIREIRKYKFALIRIRFPDDIFLQGTFGVYEKITCITEFVRESLDDENLIFNLKTPDGQYLTSDSEATLIDFKLAPAAVLIFIAEVSKPTYLKPEVLMLAESLTLS